MPKLAIAWRLAKRALGLRTLMDVIPLDASLVRGSHGRADNSAERSPVVLSSDAGLLPAGDVDAKEIKQLMLDHVFGDVAERKSASIAEYAQP
jgi:hypothetical protein